VSAQPIASERKEAGSTSRIQQLSGHQPAELVKLMRPKRTIGNYHTG
jgi:hypothetical protein